MTKWNHRPSRFRALDRRDPRHGKRFSLLDLPRADGVESLAPHTDLPLRDGRSPCEGLFADIDHLHPAGCIEVCEPFQVRASRQTGEVRTFERLPRVRPIGFLPP